MAKAALPSPELLRQLLRYEPETGKLFWLPRPVSMFQESAGRHTKPARWSANKWNTRYAGRPALIKQLPGGYVGGTLFNQGVRAHRVAWALHYGAWPKGEIDHINGNAADNRIINLRDVSHEAAEARHSAQNGLFHENHGRRA